MARARRQWTGGRRRVARARAAARWALGIGACAGALVFPASVHPSSGTEAVARRAGYIQSIHPADRTLVIQEVGGSWRSGGLQVRMGNAAVVRVWRDPADPLAWRERATSIYRWPVGTLVVVIGRATSSGPVEASRIEIPKFTTE
jgi:hypothetical protein